MRLEDCRTKDDFRFWYEQQTAIPDDLLAKLTLEDFYFLEAVYALCTNEGACMRWGELVSRLRQGTWP